MTAPSRPAWIRRLARLVATAAALGLVLVGVSGNVAFAAAPGPAWMVSMQPAPTYFAPGDSSDQYRVIATNIGSQPADASTSTVKVALPAGVTATAISGVDNQPNGGGMACDLATLTCVDSQEATVPVNDLLLVTVTVSAAQNAAGTLTASGTASGGGASDASTTAPTTISTAPVPNGVSYLQTAFTGPDGAPQTQAGSHPYEMTTSFGLNISGLTSDDGAPLEPANPKNIDVALPPGLIGDPSATPTCPQSVFLGDYGYENCPADTQVGFMRLIFYGDANGIQPEPIYNVQPPPGQPAELGFTVGGLAHVPIFFHVRTGGDYGLTVQVAGIPEADPVLGMVMSIWGVPTDPSHDVLRYFQNQNQAGASSGAAPKPFLTYPTSCTGGQLPVTMTTGSWQQPGASVMGPTATLAAPTGCDALDFSPSLSVRPDTSLADSPSGLSVDLHVPQSDDPDGLATADLKDATVTLPAGVSVSPSAANGLTACSPAEIGIDSSSEPSCPDASKIGSVQVDTPLLPDPLVGGVYVAQQNQNPFGSLLAIYVTAEADGVLVKLAGHVVADPFTGQLTTTFSNNPQLTFSDFKLDFYGGPRGVLATPGQCGTYMTTSSLSPWNGNAAVVSSDPFTINSGCVSGFSPSFTAGTQNAQAGAFSPFVLSFQRVDTDEDLSGLSVKLPPGMLAKLAGVAECSDDQLAAAAAKSGAAEQADPSCPAASQVGTVETGAGVGPDPFFLGGKAYLTGPYKGAPYGLAVVVPALAGPYDLGTVVVRQALYVDPTTAQVTAVSDPFPTILQGIPLRIRRVDVNLNRPDFTVNPTSCDPMAVTGALTSTGGLSAPVSSHFQVGGCQALGFSPRLRMALTGKGKTRSGDHPDLISTLTQGPGQANIHDVKVALPLSMALDPNNSNHVCNYDTALAVHGGPVPCPASTIVGSATAVTPLLDHPLTGKVYLVQGIRFSHGNRIRTLPTLLIPLRGQIALDLRAATSVNGAQQLVTTFSTIPDAAVSTFTLNITGGKKGLLVITGRGRSICNTAQVTNANYGAQSGKAASQHVTMSTPCGKPASLRSSTVKGHTVHVTVHVPTAGSLIVTGPGLRRQTRRPGKAQTITLTMRLTKTAAHRLSRTRKLHTKITVQWTPRNGSQHTTQSRTLTIRR